MSNGWDRALLEAKACGEVVVVRGEEPDWEMDCVEIDPSVPDPLADAAARAFGAEP